MGNTVSMNVGCCRRGHLFKLKIDTSDEMREEDISTPSQADTRPQKKASGKRRHGGQASEGGLSGIISAKKSSQLKARKKAKDILAG